MTEEEYLVITSLESINHVISILYRSNIPLVLFEDQRVSDLYKLAESIRCGISEIFGSLEFTEET